MAKAKTRSAVEFYTRVDSLTDEAKREIITYAIGGLFEDRDGGMTLHKEMGGADYIDHMTGVLAKHGLVPEVSAHGR